MAEKSSGHTVLWIIVLVAVVLAVSLAWTAWMPGSSIKGALPALTEQERDLAGRLEADVRALSVDIGERNAFTPGSMSRTVDWIDGRLREAGYTPERHAYQLGDGAPPSLAGREAENLVAEIPGTAKPEEVLVIGAHYDSVTGSPGANDNASAVAALLALAEWFRERPQARTVRFVAFANEEPPFFMSGDMGSQAYASSTRQRGERIGAMMSMDGIAYFSDEPGSQRYPAPGLDFIYSSRGNFIGFVTRSRDANLLRDAIGAFRRQASVPSEGAALPGWLPGVSWSDHWAFWQHDYPAFLVTDTLPFRDPHYHTPGDTAERLDYQRLARVVHGLKAVVARLAGS